MSIATRKTFRAVAESISQIEDPAKRKAEAKKHADVFATINPRFCKFRFYAACRVPIATGEPVVEQKA